MVHPRPGHTGTTRPLRILVVDDHDEASASLAALLELRGHAVVTVPDGLSALRSVHDVVPDVVLLDIGLPGMSGFDVAGVLATMQERHAMVLIAMTGHGSPDDRARTRDAGFDHHFTKPLDFPALEQLLSDPHPPGRLR